MALVEEFSGKPPAEDFAPPSRKKIKTSDLPLSSAQRSSIDNLLHTIKKKGEYDRLRKEVWSQYADSDGKTAFTTSLTDLAESEIEREPSLLSRDRGKATTLIEGAVDRSTIYKTVEASIDAFIGQHLENIELVAREIRKQEVGEDIAAAEQKRGGKTDEDYAAEAVVKRIAREKIRKQEESRRRREEEKERLRAEEKEKKLELERLRSADERRREDEARAEKRRQEREAERAAAEKKREEERETERQERHERRRREEKERERLKSRSRSRARRKSRHYEDYEKPRVADGSHEHRSLSRPKETRPLAEPVAVVVDEKALEEAALELLLKEGRELAAKSVPGKVELEPAEQVSRRGHSSRARPSEHSITRGREESRSPSRTDMRPNKPSSAYARRDHSRSLSREPPAKYYESKRHHSRSRSRSRTRTRHTTSRRDDEWRVFDAEAKEAWKQQAVRRREREAEAWKKASREAKERPRSRSRTPTKPRTYEKERSEHNGNRETESHHSTSHRRHHSRSRSPTVKQSRYERSRSPVPQKSYHETPSSRITRPKSPVEIDRYVPGGSTRPSHRDRDEPTPRRYERDDGYRERERDRERDSGRDRERDRNRERDPGRDRDRDRDTGRERARERDPGRERERDRERDPARERPREEKRPYVEIDRYVPTGGAGDSVEKASRRKGERSRSRSWERT